MGTPVSVLLINPWITDFAAYNLWAEPLGLFYVAAVLKMAGARLSCIDCVFSTEEHNPRPRENGCSKYRRMAMKTPSCLEWVERDFARYGMSEEEFQRLLSQQSRPDVVLVTSMMTYWYPGAIRAIELVRQHFGHRIPVVLGGIYAMLCRTHAERNSGADIVYGSDDLQRLIPLIEEVTGKSLIARDSITSFSRYPCPAHELGRARRFFAVLTGKGCPFSCTYCASHILNLRFDRRNSESVLLELGRYSMTMGTRNVAFYDDALLVDSKNHFMPLLRGILDRGMKFSIHLPNGIHTRYVSAGIARLCHEAGVRTIRLGLETADPELQARTGNKTGNEDYRRAVACFREAGYDRADLGTYVMLGLPGQMPRDVERTIQFVYRSGGAPHISYFSPIPGTAIWGETLKTTSLPIEDEPLFQNNTVFILKNSAFSPRTTSTLKNMAIELRSLP